MSDVTKTIVVKIGCSSLFQSNGEVSLSNLARLTETIHDLLKICKRVVIVSSGAIAFGRQNLDTKLVPQSIAEKQALASVGQVYLMNIYKNFLDVLGLKVGQVLVSKSDFRNSCRSENTLNTFENLFKLGVIPIVNENDTVAVEEIKYGDNDELASLVAGFLEAEWLFILTNHDGVCDPSQSLRIINKIESHEALQDIYFSINTYGKYSNLKSKLKAAEIASYKRTKTVIINGSSPNKIIDVIQGEEVGTLIEIKNTRYLHEKEFRLKYTLDLAGNIYINPGAANAVIERKASLLSVGIVEVEGNFTAQSIVAVCDENKHQIFKGVVKYDSNIINRMKGMKSGEIENFFDSNVIIHRDDMIFI